MDYDDDSGAVKKARLRREGRVVRRFALGTIHILRKQRGWVGGIGKMLTFAYMVDGFLWTTTMIPER